MATSSPISQHLRMSGPLALWPGDLVMGKAAAAPQETSGSRSLPTITELSKEAACSGDLFFCQAEDPFQAGTIPMLMAR